MPQWLRYLIAFICIAVGLVPLVIAPGLAESYGWDRSTGSNVGALITVTWFGLGGWISLKIIRRQEWHKLGGELNRLLEPYRDDDSKKHEG